MNERLSERRLGGTCQWVVVAFLMYRPVCAGAQELNVEVLRERMLVEAIIEKEPIDVVFDIPLRAPTASSDANLDAEWEIRGVTPLRTGAVDLASVRADPAHGTIKFVNADETSLEVTIKRIVWPGEYRLDLRIWKASGDGGETGVASSTEIPVDIRVYTKPVLATLQDNVEVRISKCQTRASCWLAAIAAPDASRQRAWPIRLRNDSLTNVFVSPELRLVRNGDAVVEEFSIRAETRSDSVLSVGRAGTYRLAADMDAATPGLYEGNAGFLATPAIVGYPERRDEGETNLLDKNSDGAVIRNQTEVLVPVTLAVRTGVVPVILVIILGILAGRVNEQISTPEAQARLSIMDRLVELKPRIANIQDEQTRLFCQREANSLSLDLDDRTVETATISTGVDRLGRQVRLFSDLEGIIGRATDAEVRDTAEKARAQIIAGKFDDARATMVEIANLLARQSEREGLEAVPAFERLTESMVSELEDAARLEQAAPIPAPTFFTSFARMFSGARTTSTRSQYVWIRPLSTAILLVALTALGVFTLYSGEANKTFGAEPLADYVPLFLWGFGSDVLQKRLAGINFVR